MVLNQQRKLQNGITKLITKDGDIERLTCVKLEKMICVKTVLIYFTISYIMSKLVNSIQYASGLRKMALFAYFPREKTEKKEIGDGVSKLLKDKLMI